MSHIDEAQAAVKRLHGAGYDEVAACAAVVAHTVTASEYDACLDRIKERIAAAAHQIQIGASEGDVSDLLGRLFVDIERGQV